MMTELDSFSSSSLTTGHHSDCLSELVQSTIFDDDDHGGGNGFLPPISSFASADLFSSSSSSTAAAAAAVNVEDEESYQFLESFFLSSIPSSSSESSPPPPPPPTPSLYDPSLTNCYSTPVLTTTNTNSTTTTTTSEALSSTVENAGPPPTQMLLLNATSSNQLLPSMTAHFTGVQTFPPPPPPAQTKTKSSLCSRGAPAIVVRFTRQPPESVRKINFFNFSLELFEVGEPSSVSPYQQQQQQFQQPQQSLQPVTVWKSSFVRFLGEEDGTRNGAQYHLHLVRPRKSASSSPTKSSFPTKEQFSTVVTLTLLVVDAATKAVVRYEGGDKNADLQRVLLTHSAICSRCSIQKQLCGNEKDSPSAPRLDQSRITGGTSLTFFLRCNQNCFKAAAANSFSGVSTKTSGPRLSPLTIEALSCRRRKFQLAVIVDVGVAGSGSSNDEVVAPVAYFSTEFFVHNSSKMLLGDGRSSSVASTLHSRSPSSTPLLPARKKLCTAAEKKKQQPKKEEESSNAAEEVVVRTSESYQQQPSFTITSLSPAQGLPGTELHLLGLHLDSTSFWSSPEVKLFLQGWQLPLTTAQPLLPTALSPNALKVSLPRELASLVPPNSLLTVALVDQSTGTTAHCPVPFQLLEEEEKKKIASDSQMRSSSSGVSAEEEEFLLSRLHQLLPERSALMEGGRYSASFDGSKQTLSSSSSPSTSSPLSPSPVSSHEILERAALFLDWYHGQQQQLQQQKLMKQQQQQQYQQQQQQQQETLNSFLVSETAAVPEQQQQQLGVINSDPTLTEAVVPVSASLPSSPLPPSPPLSSSSLEQQHQEKLPSFATLTSAIKNNSCNNNGENAGFYFQPADQVISSTELLYDCSPPPPPPLSSSSSSPSSSSSSTTEQAATAGSGYEANDFIMYDYYEHFQSQAQQQQQLPDPLPPAQSCNQSSFY